MGLKHKFSSVVFETTSKCNLDCQYCYNIHKVPGGPEGLTGSFREAKKALGRLFKVADVSNITMSGGEPFLSERFMELVLFCRMKGAGVTIISNGNAAGREQYQSLVELGVNVFEFPLHSPTPEEHDEMTCVAGSWANAVKSLETVQDLGALAVPVIVLTKINLHCLEDTLRFLAAKGLRRIMLNRFNIGGQGISCADKLNLTEQELKEAYQSANEIAKELNLNLSSNVCSPVCVLDPKDFRNISFAVCTPELSKRPVTLDTKGNLRYCNHSPRFLGNIYESSLDDILSCDYACSWNNSVPDICSDCKLWDRCFGGCRAAAEQLGGDVQQVDPVLSQSK